MITNQDDVKRFLQGAAWYHTIDFPGGISSKGAYDHRKFVNFYKLPKSLVGQEVLDVGCADGFFSFELEKRGAKRVLAVDTNKFDGASAISPSPIHEVDYQRKYSSIQSQNTKFLPLAQKLGLSKVHLMLMATRLLNSGVEYQDCSIYELHKLNHKFDVVFCGDLIEHLKNPIEAVEELSRATKTLCIITIASLATGSKVNRWLSLINFNPLLRGKIVTYWGDRGGTFFHFSTNAFVRLLKASGFSRIEIASKFNQKNFKSNIYVPHVVYHCWK
ncbi:hypothetical protein A2115_01640 [Candidatus Woesebacteria bacterium GWA1_41_8]|uniref:Methyltransferase type 11 domain-containing protein n=1 Tax=Candidatus Woesebacteria bacterium GWA1_41_8 TaxID=1802471 RepID=A0A1F7WGP0_9BACT|nr:MAG: hypothetical protein A2115_01640 [Candidatus Woesebacteria bacterium GWA1_41_8]